MARRSKITPIKKIITISVCLIVIECFYLVLFPKPEPPSAKEAIAKAAEKYGGGIDDRRREQLKVQMAVQLFRGANSGRLPTNLNELVPVYFDRLPLDPATNQPFEYKVDKGIAMVGPAGDITTKPANSAVTAKAGNSAGSEEAMKLALLEAEDAEKARFVYDPTGKRDPFRPFDFSPKLPTGTNLTPLEKYDLGQLKLTAVLKGFDEPMAIVENAAGKGFPAKKGAKIGLHGGEIIEVQPDRLLILETTVDFTGEKKQKTIEMRLRTKDMDDNK